VRLFMNMLTVKQYWLGAKFVESSILGVISRSIETFRAEKVPIFLPSTTPY
jgi:hypothetical protein